MRRFFFFVPAAGGGDGASFVPKIGFDEDSARQVGMREQDLANIRNRIPSWAGLAVIYVIPRTRAITRLAEGIDVQRQISLKGNAGEVTFAISLVRGGLDGVSDAKQSQHTQIGPSESASRTDATTFVSSVRIE